MTMTLNDGAKSAGQMKEIEREIVTEKGIEIEIATMRGGIETETVTGKETGTATEKGIETGTEIVEEMIAGIDEITAAWEGTVMKTQMTEE